MIWAGSHQHCICRQICTSSRRSLFITSSSDFSVPYSSSHTQPSFPPCPHAKVQTSLTRKWFSKHLSYSSTINIGTPIYISRQGCSRASTPSPVFHFLLYYMSVCLLSEPSSWTCLPALLRQGKYSMLLQAGKASPGTDGWHRAFFLSSRFPQASRWLCPASPSRRHPWAC